MSLTSMLLTDGGRPVTAAEIAAILPPLTGELIDEFPPHLIGRAAYGEAVQPARASHAMSGMLVATGTALCVTITTDDFDWARQVWLSIRHHPIPPRADEPRH